VIAFISLIFLIFSPMAAYAGAMIYGAGNKTCGSYVNANKMEKVIFRNWFYGFASAESASADKDVLEGRDPDAIELWFENYCKNNPLDSFFSASMNLFIELSKKK
jgi:hypothetical protein